MEVIQVIHVDAFTHERETGNAAGVVLTVSQLSNEKMQRIAKKVGFNETVFVLPSNKGDFKCRFFAPNSEMAMCGHASIAALYALYTEQRIAIGDVLNIETKSGLFQASIVNMNDNVFIKMEQHVYALEDYKGSKQAIADAMHIHVSDIDHTLPIQYACTGGWTCIVPITSLDAFEKMRPDNKAFQHILTAHPDASLHPIIFESRDHSADIHARHFSASHTGSIEDAVTGTAAAASIVYMRQHQQCDDRSEHVYTIEQGYEMGRPGKVHVALDTVHQKMYILGTATINKVMAITLD